MAAWQLGPLGALRSLPAHPVRGIKAPVRRIGGTHRSLSGRTTVDTLGHKRTWEIGWEYLAEDELAYVQALHHRLVDGPLRLVDPAQRNRASMQVGSGGSYRRDTAGFTASAGTITWAAITTPPAALAGLVAGGISWAAPATANVTLRGDDTSTTRIPAVTGETYTASVYVRTSSSSITVQATVLPYTAAGVAGTLITGSVSTLTANTWSRLTVTWVAASGGDAVAPGVRVTSAAAHTLITTGWQVELASTAGLWLPGAGCPVVVLDQAETEYPQSGYHHLGLSLLEV
jgi:hypothetical protein